MPLPSLRNLQVFEAAARHRSFRAAAQALFLTPGAISRQVRALEAAMGVALFVRAGQGVVLTLQGQRLQEAVAQALSLMSDAVAALSLAAEGASARLTVTALPSFASRWLLPRLSDFEARHPGVKVELIATTTPLQLAEQGIDLGIRYGGGRWNGVVAERLAREQLFPVAAKSGIAGHDGLPRSAQALLQYPLLNPYDDWERWFRRAGVTARSPFTGTTFDDASSLLLGAERGDGIALGRKWLVVDALAAGTLIRLPGPMITAPRAYYLIYPENQPLSPHAEAFAAWIRHRMGGK